MPTGETIFLTLLEVSILILLADLAGGVLSRYGFPRVVAELLIGLALSPYALGSLLNAFMHLELFTINDYLLFLTNLSIILLLFASGLEHGLSTLREGGIYGVLAAVFGGHNPPLRPGLLGLNNRWVATHGIRNNCPIDGTHEPSRGRRDHRA